MEKARVLIVDEHREVLSSLHQLLESEESSEVVGVAMSGADAIEQARLLHPDVVLIDFPMSDIDGIEAASTIRSENPATDVIILSVFEAGDNSGRARRAGVLRWIPKCFPPERLLMELRGLVAQRHEDAWLPTNEARGVEEYWQGLR